MRKRKDCRYPPKNTTTMASLTLDIEKIRGTEPSLSLFYNGEKAIDSNVIDSNIVNQLNVSVFEKCQFIEGIIFGIQYGLYYLKLRGKNINYHVIIDIHKCFDGMLVTNESNAYVMAKILLEYFGTRNIGPEFNKVEIGEGEQCFVDYRFFFPRAPFPPPIGRKSEFSIKNSSESWLLENEARRERLIQEYLKKQNQYFELYCT